jgi:hypothetical protein
MDTNYEDGFRAGFRSGLEEINRTTYERLSEDERREIRFEEEPEGEFNKRYPLV